MKLKLFLLISVLCLCFTKANALEIIIDENQAEASQFKETETAGKYESVIKFYESSKFVETDVNVKLLEYSIFMPVGFLSDDISYEIAEGYTLKEVVQTNEDYYGVTIPLFVFKIEKIDLGEKESILQKDKQNVVTIKIKGKIGDLCSSKLTVRMQKVIDKDNNKLNITALIQRNALNVQDDYIIGFDNNSSKVAGVYFDKNSEYINIPISIFTDRCTFFEEGSDEIAFENIEGVITLPEGLEIESISTKGNKDIATIELEKESGSFYLNYKTDLESKKYIFNNITGFNIRVKRTDINNNLASIGTISISSYIMDVIETKVGRVIEYMMIPGTLGDWNTDDKINVSDLILARRFVAESYDDLYVLKGLEDINEDEDISILDIIYLRKNIASA